ncbi:hypothetical protein GCK32_019798 [Trichostrongylus colubriformis]|uniref:Uncharacterized protein n=1 Tax=Trichostrongylus colubriformis TaxID=6319 RepID=A0AAN8J2V7_TRICO
MPEGALPLEIRFLHDPISPYAFAGATLGSSVFLFHPEDSTYVAKCVVKVPSKTVSFLSQQFFGWKSGAEAF